MDAGTAPVTAALAVPAAPTAGAASLTPSVSRYRSLRGKSVSSPRRAFDVFEDNRDDEGDETGDSEETPTRRRRRSKSLSTAKSGTAAGRRGGFPTSATTALTPKPINLFPGTKNSSRKSANDPAPKAWADLKPPPALPIDVVRLQALNKRAEELEKEFAENPVESPAAESPAATLAPNSIDTAAAAEPATPTTPLTPSSPFAPADRPPSRPQETDEDEEARCAAEVARLDAETDRILAEQKKKDLLRLQAQLATTPPPKPKSLILEKLTFFSRSAKKAYPRSQPGTPTTIASTIFSLDFSRASSLEVTPPPDKMSFIEQGGRGIVPQTDAPTSAVNGGERRVTVRCLSSTINLPVTTDTSPVDIVFSSANLISHHIDPDTSIVVECFVVLGLERRLRRYERVRDVMNSWDRDQQNSLLILSYNDRQEDRDLDITSVPRTEEAPNGFSLQLYHSSRPGKWTKRWITLLESGQVFASKKPDAKPTDKDSTPLCHLSDFDIYTPRDSEMRRHLKPPKKFCYAIKSQQKTVVFPNGENYVHFFCTDDGKLAQRFHDLVHGWRSWYLVNKQVDLQRKQKAPQSPPHPLERETKDHNPKNGGNRLKLSVDEKPYLIGQFQPLINMDRFDKPIEEFGKDLKQPKSPESAKENSKPKPLVRAQTQPHSLPQTPMSEPEFSAGGLLGDAYEKRKLQNEKVTTEVRKVEGPFTEGPSLLNGGAVSLPTSPGSPKSEARPWMPSAQEHSARIRSQSIHATKRPVTADAATTRREKPPPMGGLIGNIPGAPTGRRREPQGHGVRPPPGSPLINFASGGAPSGPASPRSAGPVPRSSTRISPSSSSGPASTSGRQRSRSTASSHAGSSRRFAPEGQPPVPPLPMHPARREAMPALGGSSRSRDARPQEPLVNRAR